MKHVVITNIQINVSQTFYEDSLILKIKCLQYYNTINQLIPIFLSGNVKICAL